MTTFALAFWELVVPDLRRECATQGWLVAHGHAHFSEAFVCVYQMASKRGATMLPNHLLLELEDWIMTTILKSEDQSTRGTPAWYALTAKVLEDVNAHMDRVDAYYAVESEAAWATT